MSTHEATYVYLFEDGRIAQSSTPPTEIDLLMVGDGTLQVLAAPIPVMIYDVDSGGVRSELKRCELNEGGWHS